MSTVLSKDRQYRYLLTREFLTFGPISVCVFVMLNPSTADEETDDNTIRKCVTFAKLWGHNVLAVVNLFAYRATKPEELSYAVDPVGPDNDWWLDAAFTQAATDGCPVICAWGAHGYRQDRGEAVRQMILRHGLRPQVLGLTSLGQPLHPLYLPATTTPVAWD